MITLQPIAEKDRKTEESLWVLFNAAAPEIFGAVLDVVAAGMEHLPTTNPANLPRMADFGKWGEAVCRGMGKAPGNSWLSMTPIDKRPAKLCWKDRLSRTTSERGCRRCAPRRGMEPLVICWTTLIRRGR